MGKIFVLAAGNERGGAASHLIALANAIVRANLEGEFEFVLAGQGELEERLSHVLRPVVLGGGVMKVVDSLAGLLAKSPQNAVLHSHGPRMNVMAWLATRRVPRIWVSTIHSNIRLDFLSSRWKTLFFTRFNAFCLRHATGLFIINKQFAEFFPRMETMLVPNAVDLKPLPEAKLVYESRLRERLGLSDGVRLIGIAARLDPVKDISTIIRAVARLKNEQVHFVVAGDGDEKAKLQALAAELYMTHRVHFLGYIDWVGEFYAGLHIHVLASLSEGTPSSLLEAGFYGVVNIGTEIPGVTHLITNGETGLCFPVGDDISLASAVDRLLSNPQQSERLVSEFRQRVLPRFTPEAMLNSYLTGYTKLQRFDKASAK